MARIVEEEEDSLRYDELLERYKNELSHFQFVRKKEMILKLAKKLEEAGTPKEMIASILITDLREYDVHPNYIRSILPEEFRDPAKKRVRISPQKRANEEKIPIELTTDGSPAKDWEAEVEELKLLADKRGEQLEEQKKQFTELVKSTNLIGQNSKNTDVKDSLEYKAIESELYLVKEERDELKQLATRQIKEHPEQTFQNASAMAAAAAAPLPNQQQQQQQIEAKFPAKDLSTFWLDAKNAKQFMFLTIKDSTVVTWESDWKRDRKKGG